MKPVPVLAALVSLIISGAQVAPSAPTPLSDVPGAVTLKTNGGWCWYQGPRTIVTKNGQLVFTTIAGDSFGGYEAGDLWATAWDLNANQVSHFELHDQFHRDDHDVAGLLERPDGRILAIYGKHGGDQLQRSRITTRPADISAWSEEAQFDAGERYTYSNVFQLSQENNRIYNFSRTRGRNPNSSLSEDGGKTWRYGWRLLSWEKTDYADDPRYTGIDGSRPYLRYASDGADTIHFVTTDDHPRAYDNSIYHGFYCNGKLHDSGGKILGEPGSDGTSPLKPNSFTELFKGGPDRVAWTVDLELDKNDHPYTAFSVQIDGAVGRGQRDPRFGQDHRYYYARWNGNAWQVNEMAYGGTSLYTRESDYTGLVALDPQDPNFVVIATNAHPKRGTPLISKADGKRHWELYRGRTRNRGKSWRWTAITSNSTVDNLRPNIPSWDSAQRVILWARGDLATYQDYRLDITGILENR